MKLQNKFFNQRFKKIAKKGIDTFTFGGILVLGFIFFGKDINPNLTADRITENIFGVEFAAAQDAGDGGGGCTGCGGSDASCGCNDSSQSGVPVLPPQPEPDQDIEIL